MDHIHLFKRVKVVCIILATLFLTGTISGQLLINEFMSSNASTLVDQFGDYPDWIELHNACDSSVQLDNFWLTDDISQLRKWNFPGMLLTPGSFFIVFASGNDVVENMAYWHTVINSGEEWRYLVPESKHNEDWKTSLEYTSGWQTGKSGIGYGDNDDATVIDPAISLYMQKEFFVDSISQVTDAALFMDYDDGFVAYLNGTEIARSFNMGDSGRVVNYDAPAVVDNEARMYAGLPPEGFFMTHRLDLLKEGSNVLAIEVHNVNRSSSDMTSIPFFLLGYDRIMPDLIYQNPFFVIKDKYPHTNFKINAEGEAIFLSDNDGNITDKVNSVKLPTDFSYGRIPEDATQFGYYEDPTPGTENGPTYSKEYITDSVAIISQNEVPGSSQEVLMVSNITGDQIYYTFDGSEPDQGSYLYKNPLYIRKTIVLKARIYRSNQVPGPVTTKTIFIGGDHDLPVISVSMDPFDLWDHNTGIYVMGPYANSEVPHHGANFWQDWERPAHFELYNVQGEQELSQSAGTKIFGGWSRAHPQKSMAFFARKNYGNGKFSYPLFKDRLFDTYEAFVMRNSGNDWCNGNFRDALTGHLSAQMDIDHQAYQPYVMYLNGEYWGIINMREKVNEHFIASNNFVYADDVNILTGNRSLVHGSAESYNKLYNYVTTTNLAGWQEYGHARTMMDVHNFMRFWVVNVYVDNKDWPGNNNKYWSTNAPGSLYRWISYDTDFGFSIWDHSAYKYNTLQFSFGEGSEINWANQPWAVAMVKSLIGNNNFKRQFINEFADRMNTTFHPDEVIPVIDSFEQRLMSEAPDHYDKWIGDPNNWLSFPNWMASVERMRTYVRERPQYMRQHIMSRFNISGTSTIGVNVSDQSAGHVKLNSIELHQFPFTGLYFKGIPIRLEAIPAPGHIFSHWEGFMSTDSTWFLYGMDGPAQFTAVFTPVDSAVNIVINEINYSSHINKNTEDWVELYNNSGVAVELSGWMLSDGFSDAMFEIPAGTVIRANSYMVFSRSRPDFKRFYPELKAVLGDLPFGFSSAGEGVALYDETGELHDYVIYQSVAPWPEEANGTGATLELINPGTDNLLAENWKASGVVTGTPGAVNSQFEGPLTATVKEKRDLSPAMVYPSPFNVETNVHFHLENEEEVMISVYSTTGKLVTVLSARKYEPGDHTILWSPEGDITQGLYFITIRSSGYNQTLKVVYQRN
ncbi:MAG: CotH kinase family protein [Bacteroidales bacterium]